MGDGEVRQRSHHWVLDIMFIFISFISERIYFCIKEKYPNRISILDFIKVDDK